MQVYALQAPELIVPDQHHMQGKLVQGTGEKEKPPGIKRPVWIIALILASALFGIWKITDWYHKQQTQKLLRANIPRIIQLSEELSIAGARSGEGVNSWRAFVLAKEIKEHNPGEPELPSLWPRFSKHIKITTDPPGTDIWAKAYEDGDSAWIYMGTTPFDSLRFPFGYSNLRFKKKDLNPWKILFGIPIICLIPFVTGWPKRAAFLMK